MRKTNLFLLRVFKKKNFMRKEKGLFFLRKGYAERKKKINDVCFGLFKIKLSRRVQFWFELRIFDLLFKGMLPFKMRKLFWNSRHVKFYDEEVFISTWTLVIDFLVTCPFDGIIRWVCKSVDINLEKDRRVPVKRQG